MDADYPVCTHPDETVSTDGWCECGTDLREVDDPDPIDLQDEARGDFTPGSDK